MPNEKLRTLFSRLETWPPEAQEQALDLLRLVEQELEDPYELTAEDRAAIDRGIADADAGRFASPAEMEELFARYRRK